MYCPNPEVFPLSGAPHSTAMLPTLRPCPIPHPPLEPCPISYPHLTPHPDPSSAPNALPPNPSTIEPEALRRGNMSSLGFTSKEQRNLGLLVHLMTSNPKIDLSVVSSHKGFFTWNCVDLRVCGGHLHICSVLTEGRLASEGAAVTVHVFTVAHVSARRDWLVSVHRLVGISVWSASGSGPCAVQAERRQGSSSPPQLTQLFGRLPFLMNTL